MEAASRSEVGGILWVADQTGLFYGVTCMGVIGDSVLLMEGP